MFRNVFKGLTLVLALAGCSDASTRPNPNPPPTPDAPKQNDDPLGLREIEQKPVEPPQVHPGGSSGSEGSIAGCQSTSKTLESDDARSDVVGVSRSSLLALANRKPEISLRWWALDAGPKLENNAASAMLKVEATGPAVEVSCQDPNYPEKYRQKPRVELPVVITLRSADGALDARIETTLRAETADSAATEAIDLEPEAVGGTIGGAVTEFYSSAHREMLFEIQFGPNGSNGWVGGPFSPHKASPCAYTAYATWPADAECWPLRAGRPSDDTAALEPTLARINRSLQLQWSDRQGERTEARFEVKLADGVTCSEGGQLEHPVNVHVVTADGRVDLTTTALLRGGPSTVDPWPENLADVEPFSLSLMGAIAMDRDAIRDQLGIDQKYVSAAIVSFYVGSPVTVESPVLTGRIRVTPIDRTGFATPLPTVELPGGDSERCFSNGAVAPILRGELSAN